MPFKSKSQQRFMFSQHPEMAKEWADKTPDISKLPEHVKKMAFGGETNPKHETLKAMENNPTAGFAEGGMPEPQDVDQQGLQTPPEVLAALGMLAGGANMAEDVPEMLGNESGAITLGGNAPEMEGMADQGLQGVTRYSKGVMGKGTPNEMTIWGVKGDPAEIAKLGYGSDPASIPEHILDKFGVPESVDASGQNAPNSFAEGGEAKPTLGSENPILAKLKEMLSSKPVMSDKSEVAQADAIDPVVDASTQTPHMDDGGDISAALQQLIHGPAATAAGYAMNPMSAVTDAAQALGPKIAQAELPTAQSLAGRMAGQSPTPPPQPQTDPAFMAQLQQGVPGMTQNPNQPPVQPPAQPLPKTVPQEDTNLYQGITAEDRAALANKLVGQTGSPGGMITNGLAGLGDAISNSFGKGGSNFQQQNRQNMANQANAKIGVMDTQRQQRMQDLQAKIAVQENDPNSPYSQGSRAFAQAMTGKRFPSGVSASQIKMFFPDVAKIMDAQLTSATALHGQQVEAQKAGANMGFGQRLLNSILGPSPAESALQSEASGGQQAAAPKSGKLTSPSGISYTVNQ